MAGIMVRILLAVVLILVPTVALPVQAQPRPEPAAEMETNLARYRQLAEDLSVTIAQTEIIQRQIGELQQQITQRRAAVGRVASATYRSHRADSLHVLIDASSTDEMLDRLLLLDAFARRQQQEIDALTLTSARFDAARRTLDSLIAQQRSQQQSLVALRVKIQTAQR